MNADPDVRSRVPDDELAKWTQLATKTRVLHYTLAGLGDPHPASDLAGDDTEYRWEKCSAWVRQYVSAALDHLLMWANVVVPLGPAEDTVVINPPRPYYTLARGALESAAQAMWVLEPAESPARTLRHLRLLHEDLRELAAACKALGDSHRETQTRRRMAAIGERVAASTYPPDAIKKSQSYHGLVRECAPRIGQHPDELEAIWRACSAAAHGKNWFLLHAHSIEVGDEYEPGYFRATMTAEATGVTEAMQIAVQMTSRAVELLVLRSGYNPPDLVRPALARVLREAPLKDGEEASPRPPT